MNGHRQTKLFPTPYNDLEHTGRVLKHQPSKRLRCFLCGKFKAPSQGEWLKAPTTVKFFTCNKCIEEHGKEEIINGYEHL